MRRRRLGQKAGGEKHEPFIEEEGGVTLPFDTEETARLVVEAALELEKCPYEAEVNLLLTTDEEIHKMNLEFRQIDRPTDVLSFPMAEYDAPADFSCIDEESDDLFDPESGELMLGDIVIPRTEYCLRLNSTDTHRNGNLHF